MFYKASLEHQRTASYLSTPKPTPPVPDWLRCQGRNLRIRSRRSGAERLATGNGFVLNRDTLPVLTEMSSEQSDEESADRCRHNNTPDLPEPEVERDDVKPGEIDVWRALTSYIKQWQLSVSYHFSTCPCVRPAAVIRMCIILPLCRTCMFLHVCTYYCSLRGCGVSVFG